MISLNKLTEFAIRIDIKLANGTQAWNNTKKSDD